MKESKHAEEQVAFTLRQAETGARVEEICRKFGISQAAFYNWKKKFGGLVCQNCAASRAGVSGILCASRVNHSVTTNRSSKCIANCGFA